MRSSGSVRVRFVIGTLRVFDLFRFDAAPVGLFEPLRRPLNRLGKAGAFDRFEQVIDGVDVKGLDGEFVVGGDKRDQRHLRFSKQFDGVEAGNLGHFEVENGKIGLDAFDQLDGIGTVFGFADDLDLLEFAEDRFQEFARRALVVGYYYP